MNEYQSDGYWVECAGINRFISYQDYDYPEDYQEEDCFEDYIMIPTNKDVQNEF